MICKTLWWHYHDLGLLPSLDEDDLPSLLNCSSRFRRKMSRYPSVKPGSTESGQCSATAILKTQTLKSTRQQAQILQASCLE